MICLEWVGAQDRTESGERRWQTLGLVDGASASVLTAAQRRELAALAALPDDTIDYSDIPPLTERFWENAVRNPFYRPVKSGC